MSNVAIRLINLVMLLQSQPGQKASYLSQELGVSVRTLHRYFSMLDEMGIPVYSERGPYGGFYLVRGYRLPPLVLTPDESVAVSLGLGLVEEMWGSLYREAAHGAQAKLENVLPDEQRQEAAWARLSLVATGMHRADLAEITPILEKLRRAARDHCRTRIKYQGVSGPEPGWREFDPYGLVHRWGWWYVVGYCHLRQELRTFRVDRILEAAITDAIFQVPKEFNLYTYLENEYQNDPQICVFMRFLPDFARIARHNQPYWSSLEEQQDGSVLVSFHSPTLEWAASTALMYGPAVEILEPPALRQLVADWVATLIDRYTSGGTDP